MAYIECKLSLKPFRPFNEILVAQLSELNFESFTEEEIEGQLFGYIKAEDFELEAIQEICANFQDLLAVEIETKYIEKENWNKKWEENFEAIEISNFCLVRAPFHKASPAFEYEVVIEPKMSFGTGHHQTTQLTIELMQSIDFTNKNVLDMGSGTGILGILAAKMGATVVDAIDIEEWAFENMQENAERNEVLMSCFQGDASLLENKRNCYDVIFANINKNILLEDMPVYNAALKKGGFLLISGFFESDSTDLIESDSLSDFECVETRTRETWCAIKFKK